MEFDLNKKLVNAILKYIPKNEKSVVYLVNTLNLSRESAYRRLRGDIPFTIQELVTLASKLEFSIDNVFEQEKQNQAFFDVSRASENSTDFFLFMLKKYSELHDKVVFARKKEAQMAFNSFPPPFFADYNYLFKFSYYKWLYQENTIHRDESFQEVILPEEAVAFQRKLKGNMIQGRNVILILDMNIFLNLIKEIQYFYQRKILTDKELLLLKAEMINMVEQYETIAQTGIYGSSRIQLYLSSLCVNSNTVYFNCDDKEEPFFWIFTINPVIIQNTGFVSMQLKWLNSLKRQSALISQSNEILQTEFFFKQHEYIEKYLVVETA